MKNKIMYIEVINLFYLRDCSLVIIILGIKVSSL